MSPSGCLSPSEGCIPEEMGGCPLGTQEREGGVEDGGNCLGTGRGRVSSTGREVVRVGTGQKGDMNGGRSASAARLHHRGTGMSGSVHRSRMGRRGSWEFRTTGQARKVPGRCGQT